MLTAMAKSVVSASRNGFVTLAECAGRGRGAGQLQRHGNGLAAADLLELEELEIRGKIQGFGLELFADGSGGDPDSEFGNLRRVQAGQVVEDDLVVLRGHFDCQAACHRERPRPDLIRNLDLTVNRLGQLGASGIIGNETGTDFHADDHLARGARGQADAGGGNLDLGPPSNHTGRRRLVPGRIKACQGLKKLLGLRRRLRGKFGGSEGRAARL